MTHKQDQRRSGIYLKKSVSITLLTAGLMIMAVSPGSAHATSSSIFSIELKSDSFRIIENNGEELELLTVAESIAEGQWVGNTSTDAAVFIRAIRNYSGPKAEPHFNYESTPGTTQVSENDESDVSEVLSSEYIPEPDKELLKLSTVIAVTSTTITMGWHAPLGTTSVTVSLNGEHVEASENGASFYDLRPNSDYYVMVEFRSDEGLVRRDLHALRTLELGLDDPTQSDEATRVVVSSATPIMPTSIRYVTFITDQYVEVPLGCFTVLQGHTPPGWHFGGDNRDFEVPALNSTISSHASYRTAFEVITDYQDVTRHKLVGYTHRYDDNLQFIDKEKAPTTGMVMHGPNVVPNVYINVGLSHEVGNPYCAGAIRYSVPMIEMWKSGTISVSGSRSPVPAMESYAGYRTSNPPHFFYAWVTMYQGAQGDFICLVISCPSQNL